MNFVSPPKPHLVNPLRGAQHRPPGWEEPPEEASFPFPEGWRSVPPTIPGAHLPSGDSQLHRLSARAAGGAGSRLSLSVHGLRPTCRQPPRGALCSSPTLSHTYPLSLALLGSLGPTGIYATASG